MIDYSSWKGEGNILVLKITIMIMQLCQNAKYEVWKSKQFHLKYTGEYFYEYTFQQDALKSISYLFNVSISSWM